MRPRIRQSRIVLLRRRMKAERLDALLVSQRENVRYLTGFTGSAGFVIVTQDRILLVTDFRYQIQARNEAPGVPVVIQRKDWATTLRQAAERCGKGQLWFDESSFTLDRVKQLRKLGLRMRGSTDAVAPLRQVKDRAELNAVRLAIRRAEESFTELRRTLRPGVTEREIGLRLEYLMREKGSRKAAFDIIVASGRNGAMPHATVTGRRIRRGDLVTIDFGAEAHGYYCDITRTFCFGTPTARQRKVHDVVLRAQQAAIDRVVPGAACRALDSAARETIELAGYGKYFGHATGHGIGLMVHEGPSLSPLSRDRVAEGMIFTIEPGVYLPGWGGVRIEDMVMVTTTGAKILTSLPRGL